MALVLYKGDKNSGTDPISTASATIPTGRGTLGAFGFSSTSAPAQGQQGTNSSQTQPGDSMFGNQNQQNHPGGGGGGGGGLFGSSMGNGMNPPSNKGSSLFGSTAPGPSLFGNPTSAPAPTQPKSLFGNPPAQSQPSQSLFGSTNNSNQTQSQQQQQSTGLFGSSTAQKPASSLNLFGAPSQQPQQQSASLFGNPPQAQQQSSGLFGNPQQAQQQSSSLFGNPQQTQQQPSSNLGGSLFGRQQPTQSSGFLNRQQQSQSQQNNQASGVQLDLSGLRSTTRFQDLAPALQSEIENIDKAVTQQQDWCRELRAQLPGSETMINSLPTDVSHVTNRLDQCERALESDAASINVAKKLVAKDAEDARLSFGAVDVLKLPPQLRDFRGSSHPYSSSARPGPPIRLDFPNSGPEQARRNARNREDKGAEDLVSYFMDQSISMDKTLEGYRKNMDDVEDHLRIVEMKVLAKMQELTGMQNGSRHQKLNQPTPEQKMMAELRRTLLGFEQGVLAVAAKVGEVKEEVQELSVQRDKALLDRFDAM